MNRFYDRAKFLKPDNEDILDVLASARGAMDVPVWSNHHKNIVYCLEKYQITILASEYGIDNMDLVQYLIELGWSTKGVLAIVESVSNPLVSNAEKNSFGRSRCDLREDLQIVNLSDDDLLREFFVDPLLIKFGVIILKDIDKRSVFVDTILALLKKVTRKRSTLKIILVTHSEEALFLFDYLNGRKEKVSAIQKCVIVSMIDKNPKQDIFYIKSPCADYIQKTVHTIRSIHMQRPLDGDIIAYLADEEEISKALEYLKEFISSAGITNLNYFRLSQMKNDLQTIFFPTTKGKRNVIFSTELFQNSVSQDNINYVIDCGFMQMLWYEASQNRYQRLIVPVCKYTAALRTKWRNKYKMAKVFRLYTKDDFRLLPQKTTVEMRRTELSAMVLYLKILAVENILRFDFPSPPPAKNVLATLESLYALGALNEQGQLTNPIGYFLAESPLQPCLSRCVFNSFQMGCSEEILSIAVMLQIKPIFINTTNNVADQHKHVAKRAFEAAEGDLITMLNVYNAFVENSKSKEFCRKYYLNYNSLVRVHQLRQRIISTCLQKYNIGLRTCHGDVDRVLRCIMSGYFMNVAYLHPSGTYRDLRCGGTELYIQRDSSLYTLSQPKYVVYCDLYDKSKVFMRNISVIKEDWLDEVAPHYYKRK